MSIWYAQLETAHFVFRAVGPSEGDARRDVLNGFARHLVDAACLSEDEIDRRVWVDYADDVVCVEMQPGQAFRDWEPLP